MSQIPLDRIKHLAKQCAVQDETESPSISVSKTAYALALRIEYTSFDDPRVSGRLLLRGGASIIQVRQSDSDLRQRFTIAHEIGHHLLHPGREWSDTDDEVTLYERGAPDSLASMRVEEEANLFAAELLMPEEAVRKIWSLSQSLSMTAATFQVSEPAMVRRLEELGLAARSPKGFHYLDLAPITAGTPGAPPSPIRDDRGEIPHFEPLRTDSEGRIIPPDAAELAARYAAADRVLALPSTPGAVDVSADVFRAIDLLRPTRPLFEGGSAP